VVSAQVERPERPSSPLLIRGFGVRVPGGAPAKTSLVDLVSWNEWFVPRNSAHLACGRGDRSRKVTASPEPTVNSPAEYLRGSGAWSSVPALCADLRFMYLFELVADDLCGTVTCSRVRSEVARTSLLGSAWWPGLAPRAAGMSGSGGRSHRATRHAAGSVGAGVVWSVTGQRGRRCGLAPSRRGVRWPGRRGSWVMSVVQTTALDPNSGMSAAAQR
jgi:hypothetical protein